MKPKTIITLVVVALTLSLAVVAQARHGRGKGHGGGIEMILRNVDLTEDQRTQLEALRDEHQAEMKPLKQELKTKRQQLHQLWTAEVIDEGAIWALDAEMVPLRQQMHQERLEQRLQVMNLLTPEQRAQLIDAIEKKIGRRNVR
jgi:Spy/CpxP family protein refolding chaperone